MVTIFVKHQIREGRIRIFSLFLVWKFLQNKYRTNPGAGKKLKQKHEFNGCL